MTGFYRNGYCQVGPEDTGNHSVAGNFFFSAGEQIVTDELEATLTDPFLDFTASRGNNLYSLFSFSFSFSLKEEGLRQSLPS